jgi:hypothetical protein
VVWSSLGEEDIRAILPDAEVEKHYRPSGSGVIANGRTHFATDYTVRDDSGTFVISFHQGFLSGRCACR